MYRVITDELAEHQVAALPGEALAAFAEVRTVLEVAPWSGWTTNKDKPDAPVRMVTFGGVGLVTYLILEDQRRVDVLMVQWLGRAG